MRMHDKLKKSIYQVKAQMAEGDSAISDAI